MSWSSKSSPNISLPGWYDSAVMNKEAMIAAAKEHAAAAKQINAMQLELQQRMVDISKRMYDHWNTVYHPYESRLVHEIFAKPKYEPQYDKVTGRAVAAVRQAHTQQWEELRRVGRYCVGVSSTMARDIAIAEAIAIADATNFAIRAEDNYANARADVTWARKMEALAMGRDLNKEAMSTTAAAGSMSESMYKQSMASSESASRAAGYLQQREDFAKQQAEAAKKPKRNWFKTIANVAGAGLQGFLTTGNPYVGLGMAGIAAIKEL